MTLRRDWPVIVGGCHRSGTSLVRRVLNAHSRIHCGPEVTFFRDFFGDYTADPLAHLRFFATARSIVSEDDLLALMGGAFLAVHEQAVVRAGKRRWADKSPDNVLYLSHWARLLGNEWLFVHVVRNPFDTIASIKEARFPRTIPAELEGRIAFYLRYTRAGLAFAEQHPSISCRVAYEDLVRSPQATLERLMGWLGEELEPSQFTFNAVPQQPGLEDPAIARTTGILASRVGRWPAVLTPQEAAAIRESTAEVCEALGYREALQEVATS